MNAIYVMWMRQLKRYLRSKARIVGSMAQPLLFLVALGFGFGPIYAKAGGGNYIQFLTPGIIGMSIMFLAIFTGVDMIWDREFGFLKETLVAPVPRSQLVFGRMLGGATVATGQGIIVLLLSMVAGFRPVSIWQLPFAVMVMFLIALLFTAFGTAIGSVMEDMHGFQLITNFLVMPMFFLSGALFPLDNLPTFVRYVAACDPLFYGVDAMRSFLIGVAHMNVGLDIAILATISFALLGIGSWLFSRIEL